MLKKLSGLSKEEVREELAPHADRVAHVDDDVDGVYVGRADGGEGHLKTREVGDEGDLGNPFKLEYYDRLESVVTFDEELRHKMLVNDELRENVKSLDGEVLICYCQHIEENRQTHTGDWDLCHGLVLARWAAYLNR